MKKLKDILLEGYAWERKKGQPLPTLAEVQAEYERKNEATDPLKTKIAKLEKDLATLKHQYYSDPNMTDEKSQKLRKQMGPIVRELKRAKREDRTGSAGYGKPSKSGTSEPRWQDNDGDGKWYEPGDDIKEGVEDEMSDDADMNVLNMPAIDEYGDDETHSIHADGPKNAESDVREKEVTESFWNRVKGNLHGHEYILRESFRKQAPATLGKTFRGKC